MGLRIMPRPDDAWDAGGRTVRAAIPATQTGQGLRARTIAEAACVCTR